MTNFIWLLEVGVAWSLVLWKGPSRRGKSLSVYNPLKRYEVPEGSDVEKIIEIRTIRTRCTS